MNDTSGRIAQFVGYFAQQLSTIRDLPQLPYVRQFQKNLYVSVIDALARCVYPRRGNRERFTSFVAGFGRLPEHSRVSLPHLAQLLTRVPDPEFTDLRAFVRERLGTWLPGKIIQLDQDPDLEQILKLWPSQGQHRQPIPNVTVQSFQHVNLLYAYRNSLIHEFRQPGHSQEIGDNPEPHYMHQLHPESTQTGAGVWLLHYPRPFFDRLAESGLANLKAYLEANGIDPYASFVFGDFWLEGLNL